MKKVLRHAGMAALLLVLVLPLGAQKGKKDAQKEEGITRQQAD